MTTVTPSDRTGAASSAKRPAAIPTQRSGRALRLLVLGTGHDASTFRERAVQAGAELAQRFSVRVTHVVAEDGIGEQDARVVRARTAGVPVLGILDGGRLLEEREREAESGTEAAPSEDGMAVDPAAEVGSPRRVASLIDARTEFTPELNDVRPSDVFTDSALETVLHFPPLRTGEEPVGPADSVDSGDSGDSGDADEVGQTAVASEDRLMLLNEVETTCACGDAGAASVAWALLPLVSIGLLTPLGIGYAAYRLRSRALSVATACYALAVGAAFAVSAAAPVRTGKHAAAGGLLLLACLALAWLGGTAHSFLIRRRVFGRR